MVKKMETMEIIKESLKFPSQDIVKLIIYIVIAIIAAIVGSVGGILFVVGLLGDVFVAIIGLILLIVGLILAFIIMGYQISIIKTGIDGDENVPEFKWKENLPVGIKFLVVNIVYFIIPAIITLLVGWVTNLYGLSAEIFMKMYKASAAAPANTTVIPSNVIPHSTFVSLGTAMWITGAVALILFIIFAIIHNMGESRLANTGSLGQALNIPEAFKDIGRIGWGKVISVVILIFLINIVVNAILSGLNYYLPGLSLLSIIVTPYLIFFAARATGLLYSDIA